MRKTLIHRQDTPSSLVSWLIPNYLGYLTKHGSIPSCVSRSLCGLLSSWWKFLLRSTTVSIHHAHHLRYSHAVNVPVSSGTWHHNLSFTWSSFFSSLYQMLFLNSLEAWKNVLKCITEKLQCPFPLNTVIVH